MTEPSIVEQFYTERAGERLRLFGYEMFGGSAGPAAEATVGAVGADYGLGIGDELIVTLRGSHSGIRRTRIDSEGRLVIEDLPPLPAAGRTLGELRKDLEGAVADTYLDTSVFVSVAEVRRIAVLVVGAVERPGRQLLTSFSGVLDALIGAGGISRTGSLRRLRLGRRAPEAEQRLDLYPLLIDGGPDPDIRLREGDRLFVAPLGPTVAVAGAVRRPAIFELPPVGPGPTLADLVAWAGGAVRPGALRALRLAVGADGREVATDLPPNAAERFGDGDLVLIRPAAEVRRGTIRLEGHVRRPGPRSRPDGDGDLARLMTAEDLKPQAWMRFAVLARLGDGASQSDLDQSHLEAIDLAAALADRDSVQVGDGDTLFVFGPAEIAFLSAAPVLAVLRGDDVSARACQGLAALAAALSGDPDGPLARGAAVTAAADLVGVARPCPPLFDQVPDLLHFALRHAVLDRSGGSRPGLVPVVPAAPTGRDQAARAEVGSVAADAVPGEVVDPAEPVVALDGHVRYPGVRPLARAPTLGRLIGGGAGLEDGLYPWFGVIERVERNRLVRRLIPFSTRDIAGGVIDVPLRARDRVLVFSTVAVVQALAPRPHAERRPVEPGTDADRSDADDDDSIDPVVTALTGLDAEIAGLMAEHAVQVRGAVRQPGRYPVVGSPPLVDLLTTAGGLRLDGDPAGIELSPGSNRGPRRMVSLYGPNAGSVRVTAGDAVRVNPRPEALPQGEAAVFGEVHRPGRYDLARGETLSSLLRRAGGLTADAYPLGAVLTRASAKARERAQFERAARELERGLALELLRAKKAVSDDSLTLARQLAAELRGVDPVGRVTIAADPAILAARPELDGLLEPGDALFIPKRTLTVAVSGEVQAPATLQFVPEMTVEDYLRLAGGLSRNADEDHAFVLLPDGTARPLDGSFWRHEAVPIPPGSTIVVPRDPDPFDFLALTASLGTILSQLAITAASISVLDRQ